MIVLVVLVLFILGAALYAIAHFLPSAGNMKSGLQGWSIGMMIGGLVGLILIIIGPFIVNLFANAGGLPSVVCPSS
jgi:uncharacterized protein YqgC (DUF456 family)